MGEKRSTSLRQRFYSWLYWRAWNVAMIADIRAGQMAHVKMSHNVTIHYTKFELDQLRKKDELKWVLIVYLMTVPLEYWGKKLWHVLVYVGN